MRARIIGHDEMHKIDFINSVAFESPWEPPKNEEPEENKSETKPSVWDHWLVEEGSEPCAAVSVLNENICFDGRIVPMGGIGGVSTLPQYRRKGAIRTCLSAIMNDLLEKGAVFSVLYPFSRAYYRRFGYEDGASVNIWTVPFSALQLPDVGGTIELIRPDGDFSPVHQVYAACCADQNLAFSDCRYFRQLEKSNWMKDKRYLYIWRDETGTPAGLLLFTKVDRVMDCRMEFGKPNCMLFRDARALIALLNFAKGFAADYDSIRFPVPQDMRIQNLISEGNSVQCGVYYTCMARLINVPRALQLCRTSGEGSIVISVADEYIDYNRGSWKVTFNPGGLNAVEKTDAPADVELPVGDLTQLLLGARAAEDIPMMPNVKVNNPAAPLEKIFTKKPCHIIDLF